MSTHVQKTAPFRREGIEVVSGDYSSLAGRTGPAPTGGASGRAS